MRYLVTLQRLQRRLTPAQTVPVCLWCPTSRAYARVSKDPSPPSPLHRRCGGFGAAVPPFLFDLAFNLTTVMTQLDYSDGGTACPGDKRVATALAELGADRGEASESSSATSLSSAARTGTDTGPPLRRALPRAARYPPSPHARCTGFSRGQAHRHRHAARQGRRSVLRANSLGRPRRSRRRPDSQPCPAPRPSCSGQGCPNRAESRGSA